MNYAGSGIRLDATRRSRINGLLDMRVTDFLVYAAILVVLLLECSFFFFSFLPSGFFKLCSYHAKYLTSLVAVVVAFATAVLMPRGREFLFALPISMFSIMCLIMAVVSSVYYGGSVFSALLTALPYVAVPLLYFALHSVVSNERMYTYLIESFIWVASIYALLCLLQASGFSLMNTDYQYVSYRSNRMRLIMSGDFIAFGAVLALGVALSSRRRRKLHSILFVLMLLELYFVAQTRFLLIGLAVASAVGFVLAGRNRIAKILLIAIAALLVLSQFSEELTALVFPSELSFSSVARENAYSYYWAHSRDLGIFGIGYIPKSISADLFGVVSLGNMVRGDITDIGIVGYLSRYGAAGFLVLLVGVYALVRGLSRRDKEIFSFSHKVEAWMFFVFAVAISPTMTITDAQRIFFLPLVALLIEHALASNRYSGEERSSRD